MLACAQGVQGVGDAVFVFDLVCAAVLAWAVQLLHFCRDAAQGIAFQCYAALQLGDEAVVVVCGGVLPDAGRREAPGRIPFVAVGLSGRMGCGRQLAFGEAPAFVPAVVASALLRGVAVCDMLPLYLHQSCIMRYKTHYTK